MRARVPGGPAAAWPLLLTVAPALAGCDVSRGESFALPEGMHGSPIRSAPVVLAAESEGEAAPEPGDPTPADPVDPGEPVWLSWDELSGFEYDMLSMDEVLAIEDTGVLPDLEDRFPLEVVELDGRRVRVEGYMIPFEYDDRGIHSFTLVRDQNQCCFGASPQMNHWFFVRMEGDKRSEPFDLDPLIVTGRFSVGELVEDGYVLNIYRIEAESVEGSF